MKKKSVIVCLFVSLIFSLPGITVFATTSNQVIKKQFEVVFKAEGGVFANKDKKAESKELVKQIEEKKVVPQPPAPIKDGSSFDGWYSDQKLTKAWDFKTGITANTSLFAKWKAAAKDVQVSFNSNGGSAVGQQQIKENQVSVQPGVPIKEGVTFGGWYSDQGLTQVWSFTTPITANTILYAKWDAIKEYQVSFNTGGGSQIAPQQIKENQVMTLPQAPTKEGSLFGGWYSDPEFSNLWDAATPITMTTTLFAKWDEVIKTYQVTYQTNGGSVIAPQQINENQLVAQPKAPIKEGAIFGGWYSDQKLTKVWDFKTPVMSAMILYVKWDAVVKEYQVTFNTEGGNLVDPQLIKENQLVTEPKAPIKEGAIFGGWYSDQKLTKVWDFKTPVTATMTLYAKWQATSVKEYQIIFEANGGSPVPPQLLKENQLVAEPKVPTKEGFDFGGWYRDQKLTKVWDFKTPATIDLTLYAKWDVAVKEFQVSFNTNGGTAVAAQKVKENQFVAQPKAPTKDGFTFAGWYSDQKLTKAWAFKKPVIETMTLYAKWDKSNVPPIINDYQISFNPNGGSAVATQQVKENQVVSQPQAPTKEGFVFGGWYSDQKLTKVWDFKTPVTGNLTLYAKWDAVPAKKKLTPINKSKVPLKKGKPLPQTNEKQGDISLLIGTLLLVGTFALVVKKSKVNANKM